MNCLLVVPPAFMASTRYVIRVGMAYISAMIKRIERLNVFTLNLNLDGYERPREKLVEILKTRRIDVLLAGGLIDDLHGLRSVFSAAKRYDPRIITVTGGAILNGESSLALELIGNADYGIIGEGECTVTELLTALRDGQELSDISGLVIKSGQTYQLTPPRENILDWAALPWPDYDSFGGEMMFRRVPSVHDANDVPYMIPLLTGRGCPFQCTFCYNSQGNIYRKRPLPDVLAELDYYINRYQRRDRYLLVDDLLAATPRQLEEFCQAIEPYQLHNWYMGIRMEGVTRESARWLKRAGCGRVDIGLESGCDKILKSMNKKITLSQAEEALSILKEEGVPAFSNIIFGDQQEDAQTVKESRAWREAHPEFNISYDLIRLFPGTKLYKYAVASGRLKDKKNYIENMCPAINISKLSDDEYLELKDWVAQRGNDMDLQGSRFEPNFATQTLTLSGHCGSCGAPIKCFEVPFYFRTIKCGQCQKIIRLPIIQDGQPELGEKNGLRLLQQYGPLAFWGVGHNFMKYVDNYFSASLLGQNGVYLVDKCARLDGPLGLPVHNPEIIKEKDLKTVVISVHPETPAFRIIEGLLTDEYEEVRILSLYDLQCQEIRVC